MQDATPLKRSRSLDEEHTVSKAGLTPPLESPQSQKTTGSIMIDQMIELCVNREAAAGLDVAALVNKLRVQDQHLERLGSDLAEERETNAKLMIRVQTLERTEAGTVVAENQSLRQQLEKALSERDEARALLESARNAALVQAVATGPNALKKKRWKKADDSASPPALKNSPESEAAPPKRAKSSRSSSVIVVEDLLSTSSYGDYFLDNSLIKAPVTVRDEDNAITAESDELYDAFYKNGVRFELGQDVYLKSSDDPFIGRIDRIFKQDKGEVQVLLQWWFRWDDLPADQEENASSLAQRSELWLSEKKEANPASTVIGKVEIRNAKKMSKAEVESYLAESEHRFFTRKFYDTRTGQVVETARIA